MSTPPPEAWWTRPVGDQAPPADGSRATAAPDELTVVLDPLQAPRPPAGRPPAGPPTGHPTAGPLVAGQPPAGQEQRPGPGRARHPAVLVGAAVAVVAATGLAVVGLRGLGGGGGRAPSTPSAAAAPAPVDRAAVRGDASSVQAPDGKVTYAAANTLDGDPTTAWNSDGATPEGRLPTLTYTFDAPVDLRDVTVLNGYQKMLRRTGRAPLDLFGANARVHRVRVVTDAGTWTWDLTDTRPAQTFHAPGRTRTVRLEVRSVYASATYPDVAVSEVSFTSVP